MWQKREQMWITDSKYYMHLQLLWCFQDIVKGEAFRTSNFYVYTLHGVDQSKIIYVIAGLAFSIGVQNCINKIKKIIVENYKKWKEKYEQKNNKYIGNCAGT